MYASGPLLETGLAQHLAGYKGSQFVKIRPFGFGKILRGISESQHLTFSPRGQLLISRLFEETRFDYFHGI